MELKIIQCEDLGEFENLVNEFLFLIDWHDQEPFYFNKEFIGSKHVATILFRGIQFQQYVHKVMRKADKDNRLKKEPEIKERLTKAFKLFYSKEIAEGEISVPI